MSNLYFINMANIFYNFQLFQHFCFSSTVRALTCKFPSCKNLFLVYLIKWFGCPAIFNNVKTIPNCKFPRCKNLLVVNYFLKNNVINLSQLLILENRNHGKQ